MSKEKGFHPKKHDLRKYRIGPTKAPRCPLCLEFMIKKWVPGRELFAFTCDTPGSCGIAIRVDDPFVGLWEKAAEAAGNPTCPNPMCADAKVRYFATGVGFVKMFCPKCRVTVKGQLVEDRTTEIRHDPGSLGTLQ